MVIKYITHPFVRNEWAQAATLTSKRGAVQTIFWDIWFYSIDKSINPWLYFICIHSYQELKLKSPRQLREEISKAKYL